MSLSDSGDPDSNPTPASIPAHASITLQTPDNKDEAIANLSTRLAQEQGNRREERFLWIVAVTIILDILILGNLSNNTLPLVVLALELLLLAILARRMGINNTAAIVDRFTDLVASDVKPKKTE